MTENGLSRTLARPPLFREGGPRRTLELRETRPFKNGTVFVRYGVGQAA
jgi:hypothetical protein